MWKSEVIDEVISNLSRDTHELRVIVSKKYDRLSKKHRDEDLVYAILQELSS